MKFCILLSAVLVLSVLHRADSDDGDANCPAQTGYNNYASGGCIGRNELGTYFLSPNDCAYKCNQEPSCLSYEYKKGRYTRCQLSSSCIYDLTVKNPSNPFCFYEKQEEDSKDDCSKFDGIRHKHRAVCCNKKCKTCGAVKGKCGELKDDEGKVLGNSQCCGKRIDDSGITCGSDGSNAPCKLPTPRK